MKFRMIGEGLAEVVNYGATLATVTNQGATSGNWLLDQYNNFADFIIGKEAEFISGPVSDSLTDIFHEIVASLTAVMPEIGGFLTIAAGVLIMVTGKAGKWLGYWSVGMTGVICWLINASI